MNPKRPYRIMKRCDQLGGLYIDNEARADPLDTGLRAHTVLGLKRHLAKFYDCERAYIADANGHTVEITETNELVVVPW